MLLDIDYKNDERIRLKAYNVDNSVCNAGLRIYSILHQLRIELNYYVVPPEVGFHSYPELRCACTGLSEFKTYGLAFEKPTYKIYFFEHYFNLLK